MDFFLIFKSFVFNYLMVVTELFIGKSHEFFAFQAVIDNLAALGSYTAVYPGV